MFIVIIAGVTFDYVGSTNRSINLRVFLLLSANLFNSGGNTAVSRVPSIILCITCIKIPC